MPRFVRYVKPLIVMSALLVSLLSGGSVSAQRPTLTPEQRVERRIEGWRTQLGLSTDQVKQVRAILLERERQRNADHEKVRKAAPADRPALREEMQKNMQSYRDQLHAVLTPAQQKKALKLREMQPMRRHQGGPGMGRGMRRGGPPVDTIK